MKYLEDEMQFIVVRSTVPGASYYFSGLFVFFFCIFCFFFLCLVVAVILVAVDVVSLVVGTMAWH